MRRREFIAALSSAAAWPVAARAQQAGRQPSIGLLGTDQSNWSPWTAAFVERLRELGWTEGHTVSIKYRWTEGRPERVGEIATEFVRIKVDVIVSYGTAVPALKQITSTIPIVFAIAIDPVRDGLVASLALPGGNVTGLSIEQPDAAGKLLKLPRNSPGTKAPDPPVETATQSKATTRNKDYNCVCNSCISQLSGSIVCAACDRVPVSAMTTRELSLMADLRETSARKHGGRGRPFQPGKSGNPGGRPRGDATVKELARAHTVEAIETLVAMLGADSERTRVAAAEALLSRGWGTPTAHVETGPPSVG